MLASVFESEEKHKYHWEGPYVGKMSVHSGQTSACMKSQHCPFNMENMTLTAQLQNKQKCTDASHELLFFSDLSKQIPVNRIISLKTFADAHTFVIIGNKQKHGTIFKMQIWFKPSSF